MPCAWPVTDDMKNPAHYPLATDKVCYVGDGVACVPATSDAAAHDALELIDVGYEPLEAVIDLEDALSDRVVIHDDLGTNTSYTWALKVEDHEGAVDEAFASAAYTVADATCSSASSRWRWRPRAVVAVPQPFGGDITIYSATQIPHILKVMTAITLGIPEHQVRVDRPGRRRRLRLEAQRVRRGVAVPRARPQARRARAMERDPRRRTRWPPSTAAARSSTSISPPTPTASSPPSGSGSSATWAPICNWSRPASRCSGRSCTPASTTFPRRTTSSARRCSPTMTPTDAYRGAGRPEATYAIERAMDSLAAKIGIDPLELRRRNFIPTDAYPYTAWSGLEYDSGDHDAAATRPPRLVGYDDLRARQADAEHPWRHETARDRCVVVLRDVRPGPVTRARLAELLGRRVGSGHRAGAAHRQGAGRHRHLAARAGTRDGLVDDRRREARHRSR